MRHAQRTFGILRAPGLPGTGAATFQPTLRLSTKVGKDAALVESMVALSGKNPRYGYRRALALLRREGWEVNEKRIQRDSGGKRG